MGYRISHNASVLVIHILWQLNLSSCNMPWRQVLAVNVARNQLHIYGFTAENVKKDLIILTGRNHCCFYRCLANKLEPWLVPICFLKVTFVHLVCNMRDKNFQLNLSKGYSLLISCIFSFCVDGFLLLNGFLENASKSVADIRLAPPNDSILLISSNASYKRQLMLSFKSPGGG